MNDWKGQLKEIYQNFSTQQKNKKGVQHKFDKPEHANFRGKTGVNDTGIPLTPKAAQRQQRNRTKYSYPMHLQRINERRKSEAKARHGITDETDQFNYNKNKKYSSTQHTENSRRNYSSSWHLPPVYTPRRKEYHYYDSDPKPSEPEQITYIWDQPSNKEPEYKSTGKFPKLDEAIASYKKK